MTMTIARTDAHTRALLCRLAACEIDGEAHSAANLRRTLRDLGMADAAIDVAVARVREAVNE